MGGGGKKENSASAGECDVTEMDPLDIFPARNKLIDACRLEIGKNKYKVLGRGEFGEVLSVCVEMEGEKRRFAVKVLNEKSKENPKSIRDFIMEINNHRCFHHPNILDMYEADTSLNPYMMVLEMGCVNLEEVLQRQIMLPLWRRFEIALDIAKGLEYLHNLEKPIIHRDLKPANILLVNTQHSKLLSPSPSMKEDVIKYLGRGKIADFGLASLTKEHRERIKKLTGQTGSYRYMAPEVYLEGSYDTRVDIYSFTMIFYNLLVGQPPFSDRLGEEAAGTCARKERPPSLKWKQMIRDAMTKFSAEEKKKVIAEIDEIFRNGWHTDIERRQNATTLVQQLERVMNVFPRTDQAKSAAKKALQKWDQNSSKQKNSVSVNTPENRNLQRTSSFSIFQKCFSF